MCLDFTSFVHFKILEDPSDFQSDDIDGITLTAMRERSMMLHLKSLHWDDSIRKPQGFIQWVIKKENVQGRTSGLVLLQLRVEI